MHSFRLPIKSELRRKVGIDTGPGKVAQDFIEASDIKNIVKQHLRTGTPFPTAQSLYGDVSDIPQLQDRLDLIRQGYSVYESFPEMIRKLYSTPEEFLRACDNPDEVNKLINLGVLKSKTPESTLSKSEPKALESSGGTAAGGGAIAPSGTSAT